MKIWRMCLAIIILGGLLYMAGAISYVSPTYPNNTYTNDNHIPINISINETPLGSVIFNWNGTGYNIFDGSLVLMMGFDNFSSIGENGTYFVDASKYGNNGTCTTTTCPILENGVYNGAMKFDGNDDFIQIPSISLGTNYTYSYWIYPRKVTAGTWHTIIGGTGSNQWVQFFGTTNKTDFYDGLDNYQDTGLTMNTWNHMTITLKDNNLTFYLNGNYDGSKIISGSAVTTKYIGRDNVGEDTIASLDNMMFWNRTLTPNEIKEIYMLNLYKYNATQYYLYVNQSFNSSTGLTNGIYTYYANATDINSNSYQTVTNYVTIPNSAPSLNLIYPVNNSVFNTTGAVYFHANYSDTDSNLFNTTLYVWNTSTQKTLMSLYPNSSNQILYNGTMGELLNSSIAPATVNITAAPAGCADNLSMTGDGKSCTSKGTTTLDGLFQWNITLNRYVSLNNISITSISAKVGAVTDNLTLALYNYSSAKWIIINRTINPTTQANITMNYFITGNELSNFVLNNNLAFMSYVQGGADADLRQEYMGVDVDYISPIEVLIGTNTTSINGVNTTSNISLAMVNNGSYIWNYLVCDNGVGASCAWGNSNFTFNWTSGTAQAPPSNTCTYTSGNWNVLCSDNCSINSNVNLGTNNISIIGTGTFVLSANITSWTKLFIQGTDTNNLCTTRIINGGGFRK